MIEFRENKMKGFINVKVQKIRLLLLSDVLIECNLIIFIKINLLFKFGKLYENICVKYIKKHSLK